MIEGADGSGIEVLDALLVPALVNAHGHLDLAGSAPIPPGESFPHWLLGVGAARGQARDPAAAAEAQARLLAHTGVVAVGDVDANLGAGARGRRRAGLGGLTYLEIVGVAEASARARLRAALEHLDRSGGRSVFGLSPHAPYSVSARVLPEIGRAARRRRLRLAMHLAETAEETRYLLHGDGPFVDFLETLGRGRPFESAPGLRPVAYARAAGLLGPDTAVIHGNDLDDSDIGHLLECGSPVVYCHGTHQHFGRPTHPLKKLMAAGVVVALGTDSGASNQGVDLLAECGRLVSDRPDVSPLEVLAAASRGGRTVLGWDPGPAVFAHGSPADALLLKLPVGEATPHSASSAAALVFSGRCSVLQTFHAGVPRGGTQLSEGFLDTPMGGT